MTINNGSISLKTPTHQCEDSRKKCSGKLLTTVLRHLWKLHAGCCKVFCSGAHTLAFTQSSLMSPQTVKSFRRLSRHLKTTRNWGEMPTCQWAVLPSTTAYVNIDWAQSQLNPELSSNSALSLSCFDSGQTPPGFLCCPFAESEQYYDFLGCYSQGRSRKNRENVLHTQWEGTEDIH